MSLIFIIGGHWWIPVSSYEYSGKELLNQEQYIAFKQQLSSSDITIQKIDILNDVYPILISFDVTSKIKSFPFGEESDNPSDWSLLGFIPFTIFLSMAMNISNKK